MWPTWNQAAVAALACAVLALVLRRMRPTRLRLAALSTATELAMLASLYSVWRLARVLPLDRSDGAIDRARQIDKFQHTLHLPTELSLQQLVLRHDWLARFSNYYYAILHVPALIAFLAWLFVRHRDQYSRWRNALAIVTGFCVVIRFIRVAPPRLVPGLGYIDLASHYGLSLYGPVGTGVSDQFAAMPSIHVAYAMVTASGIRATGGPWARRLAPGYQPLVALVVIVTANHYVLDAVGGAALGRLALRAARLSA